MPLKYCPRYVTLKFLFLFSAKDELFNEIVQELVECGDKFPSQMTQHSISNQVQTLVNAIWYVSGNMDTIEERAKHLPADVKHIPERCVPAVFSDNMKTILLF